MVYSKIWPVKTNLTKALHYDMNPLKTNFGKLVSFGHCIKENVVQQFQSVLNDPRATNINFEKGKRVLAWQVVQAFEPGEITPEKAHELGIQYAKMITHDKFQFVVSTHTDRAHIHNHILFNNVSFVDFHTYHSDIGRYYKEIQGFANQISRENGLSVIERDKEKKKDNPNATKSKYQNIYRIPLRRDIDNSIKISTNLREFIMTMKEKYFVKEGKYLAFKHKTNGQKRYIRTRSLGRAYSVENIEKRINTSFKDFKTITFYDQDPTFIQSVIDLEKPKFQESPGLRYWAIKQNNKAFTRTLVHMKQLGIGTYAQLSYYIEQLDQVMEMEKENSSTLFYQYDQAKEKQKALKDLQTLLPFLEELEALSEDEKERRLNDQSAESTLYQELSKDLGGSIKDRMSLEIAIYKNKEELKTLTEKIQKAKAYRNKEIHFSNELKKLANNYDTFLNREAKYQIKRYEKMER